MKHWRYLKYVVKHKWFVFRAGRKTEAPLWRLIIHDWAKFTPAEWFPYVNSFYGKEGRTPEVRAAFEKAWLHHLHNSPHHWQHWLYYRDRSGQTQPLRMPYMLVREMVADWAGAGRAITGAWELRSWYEDNKQYMVLHPDVRIQVENLVSQFHFGSGFVENPYDA